MVHPYVKHLRPNDRYRPEKKEQGELDFTAHARRKDPETSHGAADGVTAHLPFLESRVLEAIESSGSVGMNIHEVEATTGIPIQTCSPRIAPLRRKGFIVDSGERRLGGTGRAQIVWRTTR